MYQHLVNSMSGFQLIVATGILFVAGSAARRSSEVARAKGITFGLLVTAVLAVEGWLSSGMELLDFLAIDFLRLALLSVAITGFVSVVLKLSTGIIDTAITKPRQRLQAHLRQAQADREREQRDKEQHRQAQMREREWEEQRPERERLEAERREREAAEAELRSRDAERRDEARRKLLLVYHQHSPDIQESISWERYQEYVANYMSDDVPADRVEENAERMVETIVSFFDHVEEQPTYRSLTEIRAMFDRERAEVIALGRDESTTASMLADINFREDEAIMREAR